MGNAWMSHFNLGDQVVIAKSFLKELLHDTRGATAIEYGLIASLIVIAIITAMQGFANASENMWGIIEDKYEQSNT